MVFIPKLGATNKFPFGKIDKTDEGELEIAISTDKRNSVIRIDFGKPIAWIALPSIYARDLAKLLLEHAEELDKNLS